MKTKACILGLFPEDLCGAEGEKGQQRRTEEMKMEGGNLGKTVEGGSLMFMVKLWHEGKVENEKRKQPPGL